jgi:RNA polymerase sigma-70 factor (ECF subfamily)
LQTALAVTASDLEPEDDHELIRRVANDGDREAFQCLFLRFGPRVKALMIRSGADADLAEDLAQEAMLVLWRKARLYSPERGSVAAWVFTIARNLRIDRLRRQPLLAYDDVADLDLEAPDEGGEKAVEGQQRSARVVEALGALPPDQRQVVQMSFIEDLPQVDIARKLDLPLGTVKSRIRLAYGKLRERLEDIK